MKRSELATFLRRYPEFWPYLLLSSGIGLLMFAPFSIFAVIGLIWVSPFRGPTEELLWVHGAPLVLLVLSVIGLYFAVTGCLAVLRYLDRYVRFADATTHAATATFSATLGQGGWSGNRGRHVFNLTINGAAHRVRAVNEDVYTSVRDKGSPLTVQGRLHTRDGTPFLFSSDSGQLRIWLPAK